MLNDYVPIRKKKEAASQSIQRMMPAILKTPLVQSAIISGKCSPRLDNQGVEYVTFSKEPKREPLKPVRTAGRQELIEDAKINDSTSQ